MKPVLLGSRQRLTTSELLLYVHQSVLRSKDLHVPYRFISTDQRISNHPTKPYTQSAKP
jgi:hypothetical protein